METMTTTTVIDVEACNAIAEDFFDGVDVPEVADVYCMVIDDLPVIHAVGLEGSALLSQQFYTHPEHGDIAIRWSTTSELVAVA